MSGKNKRNAKTTPVTERHRRATEEALPRFERMLDDAEELRHLRRRARDLLVTNPEKARFGFGGLLDRVLPREHTKQSHVASAVGLSRDVLAAIRSLRVDPIDAPPEPLAVLARAMELDYSSFWQLIEKDHMRIAAATPGAASRGSTDLESVKTRFRSAWERDAQDDPTTP